MPALDVYFPFDGAGALPRPPDLAGDGGLFPRPFPDGFPVLLGAFAGALLMTHSFLWLIGCCIFNDFQTLQSPEQVQVVGSVLGQVHQWQWEAGKVS